MDVDTQRVLGDRVASSLATIAEVDRIVLDQHPHPDMDAVRAVMSASDGADALVAVGSGSINDIAKHAAHLTGRPYVVFGTAPSMNGYTSVSAAITEDGLKKSLPATLARGVLLDLDVMASAPQRLIASGFGDCMARPTAQTDWLLAHLLLDTPYREAPFMLLKDDENELIASAEKLRSGDLAAVELLVRTLVLSGLGMTLCGGSYPASQGEHLIAHYLDMLGHDLPPAHHGEHIAVTTLTMARLQESLLARTELQLHAIPESKDDFIAVFGLELGESCWQASAPKRFDEATLATINDRLAHQWPEIREQVRSVGRPVADLESALEAVGAPTTPEDVGIPPDIYEEAVTHARRIRDRFTTLDLAAMAVDP
jgi:glycerol-1-phosphate dehydrogenase [NAD(P)+]